MLTWHEKKEIENALHPNEPRRTVVSEALKIVQKRRGWVNDDDVKEIAVFLQMTADEVDAVATFYNLIYRQPVGKHVILICDSVSCCVMEYDKVLEHLSKRLGIKFGQTTADGTFTILPVACLGACEQAPVMMVDEELYGNLTPAKVDEILKKYS